MKFSELNHSGATLPKADYNNRHRKYDAKRRKRATDVRPPDKRMIAWDGEGMDLSGDAPQHYVLFGCSARLDDPLVISDPTQTLSFYAIADYALETKAMYPDAYHVGFSIKYDQNMIVQTLRWFEKKRLYDDGEVWIKRDPVTKYKVEWVPGKRISITRIRTAHGKRVTAHIKIEDIYGFYTSSFKNAYRATFPDKTVSDVVSAGKDARGTQGWDELGAVIKYWREEIVELEELATGFRDLLWDNGFYLTQWYGPGAFANYLRRKHDLVRHEWGGKEENLPSPALHEAIKSAYYGGHFEQYQTGRAHQNVYGYDINSAYPAAFCTVPTLAEGGFWQELSYAECQTDPHSPSSALTVYYVKFRKKRDDAGWTYLPDPFPLPFRDERANVFYPPACEGWYWAPEVSAILGSQRWARTLTVVKGWRWVPKMRAYPWRDVIEPLFRTRLELKARKDPAQMVFKLGPNSLYGKMAQRVGYDEDTLTPPKAHTLCIAGYLTSWCRAQILRMIDVVDADQLIAVETDGIYLTATPEQIKERWPDIRFGKQLGEWGCDHYDDAVYLQNGVYMVQEGTDWKVKTRGLSKDALNESVVFGYINAMEANAAWSPLVLDNGKTFMGLGLTILRCRNEDGTVNGGKARHLHCRWFAETKEVSPSGAKTSKRLHSPRKCPACKSGLSLGSGLHQLVVNQRPRTKHVALISAPYRLPWERKGKEKWREQIGTPADREGELSRRPPRQRPRRTVRR